MKIDTHIHKLQLCTSFNVCISISSNDSFVDINIKYRSTGGTGNHVFNDFSFNDIDYYKANLKMLYDESWYITNCSNGCNNLLNDSVFR